jgi:DNA-directed RNA polymerase sigma subunit (sigma70/sigma32)/predicted DNA-binding transcriptional regulator AlpA
MRKIKSQSIAQLLLQLRFTPENKRRTQLDAAEELYAVVEPDKEYPFEFVFFRITGFHPKGPAAEELIKGDELLDDLRIFISKLSGRLARPVAEQSQKIYTIEELAEVLGITTKTIYRWQKRGLVARIFIFDDGRKRFGFLQSTVDKFLKANPDPAAKAKSFSRLTDEQKQQIIKQAEKLTADMNLSRHQIINRISAETGKCHETIRYTLLNYEKANPDKPISTQSTGVIEPAQAAEIYRLFKQGCNIKDLMKRFNRNRSSIYRIINRRRAKALLVRKIEFIPSDEFLEEDAEEKILARLGDSSLRSVSPKQQGQDRSGAEPIDNTQPLARKDVVLGTPPQGVPYGTYGEPLELVRGSLPEYLQTLKNSPVLNREHEVELFRRYNYLKFLACRTRTGIKPTRVSGVRLSKIENFLAQAEEIKRRIIEANLRLVVSVARKHTAGGASLLDLVGKDFARKIPAQTGRLDKATTASLVSIHRDLRAEDAADFAAMERAHQSLSQVIEDNLTEREQYIISNRFGLVGSPIKKETQTLKQIGEELGLSKERVRQIELIALQKLRQSLSSEEFELLTG